jgi:hypothetical protein
MASRRRGGLAIGVATQMGLAAIGVATQMGWGASCLANGVAAQRGLSHWRRDADGPGCHWRGAPAASPMASRRREGLAIGVATQMGLVGSQLPGQWRRGAEGV